MNCLQRNCLVVLVSLALACWCISTSMAQVSEAVKLDKRVAALFQAGKYAEAIPLAQQELAIWEQALGPEHPNVAHSLYNLGSLYFNVGRDAEAEPLLKRALAIWEKAYRRDHSLMSFTWALSGLANLYQREGRYADQEPLLRRLLTIYDVPGHDQLDLARLLSQLAVNYDRQGRYTEEEPVLKRSLSMLEKALGPENSEVANGRNGLAGLYRTKGRYADAEPIYKRSLAIHEAALGPNNDDVAIDLNNLALIYASEGRYADAEPLYKRSLAIHEKALGPDDPILAQPLRNLANVYSNQGRYLDAEPLVKRALAIWEKAFRSDHPNVAEPLLDLADVYRNQGLYAEAEPLAKRALAIWEKALGPNHRNVALALNSLGELYGDQGRFADAEPLYKQALAIREKSFGSDHPDVAQSLNNLAFLYVNQGQYEKALPLIQRTIAAKTATAGVALPVLFGAQRKKLIPAAEALDDSLNVVQRAQQTAVSAALNALAARFSAGGGRLAELVRKDQDLANEAAALDKAIIAAVSKEPSRRDAAAEQKIKDRIAAITQERDDLGKVFAREFPDYAALSRPEPQTVSDIQSLLADDEALVIVDFGDKKSYIWAITRNASDWKQLGVTSAEVSKMVSALRNLLDPYSVRPFDAQASYDLYQKMLAPVDDLMRAKNRLSLVVNGALTSLPPQLLVPRDPTGKALKDVDWLIRTYAVTVLPSVASLKVLRGKSALAGAEKPLIGFADPVFDRDPQQLQNDRVAANVTAARGLRGTVADIAELRTALPPLPDTSNELREVAASVHADPADVILGVDATETRVKQEKLDQYRIVYFATHGLLAGDVADFAKLNAEPALVLSLPEKPTEFDDGLLTASEVAQLKLNADWVVLSACNTAAGEKPGAEALSGLARAFFYAGARSLIVSNWEVETKSAVALMTGTFAALAADPETLARRGAAKIHAGDDRRRTASRVGRSQILGSLHRRRRASQACELGPERRQDFEVSRLNVCSAIASPSRPA